MTNYELKQRSIFETIELQSDRMSRVMLDNYKQAYKDIISELDKFYGKILTGIKKEDWYNEVIKYDRLNKLLKKAQYIYKKYAELAGKDLVSMSEYAFIESFYKNQYMIKWFDMANKMSFSSIDPLLVELTVSGTQTSWLAIKKKYDILTANIYQPGYGTLSELLVKNSNADLIKIQQAITQGFIQGWATKEAASVLQTIFNTSQYNALRIAQTEFTRTANAGDYAATQDAVNQGLNIERMWLATLDYRTRDRHAALDGQIVSMGELFKMSGYSAMYPGDFGVASMDINCRCSVVNLVNGEQPKLRRGRNPETGKNEPFTFKTYDEWLKNNGKKRNDKGVIIDA